MKTFRSSRCHLIATVALVLPLAGIAQEQVLNETPASAPQVSQTRYVSDKLVLNVYAEADQSSARIATIQTGDTVEEIERSGNLVRVRLESGREGWVGASYLTDDEPAAVRLRAMEREQKAPTRDAGKEKELAAEIASLKKENTSLRGQVDELKASAVTPDAPETEDSQIMAANAGEVLDEQTMSIAQGSFPEGAASAGNGPWLWLVALVLTGALGYATGYQALARRLRRKFGGLKIY